MFTYKWFQEQAKTIGIKLSARQLNQFKQYERLLIAENSKFNLMAGIKSRLLPDHFLDSLTAALCKCLFKDCRLLDIGSGAGFPGVPLKIAFPEIKLTIIESRRKRAEFLERLLSALELPETSVLEVRAEEAGRDIDLRESYNVVVARAVAELSVLLEYALPLLAKGGWLVALKGPRGTIEAEETQKVANFLGGEIKDIISVKLIPDKVRKLILIQKVRETPQRWPRRTGLPSKRPLKVDKLKDYE